jgi:hypothetical protein
VSATPSPRSHGLRVTALALLPVLAVFAGYEAGPRPAPLVHRLSVPRVTSTPVSTPTPTPSPTPSASPTPSPRPTPARTTPHTTKPPAPPPVYYTWALIDRHTGQVRGFNLAKTSFSESTVKIWLAADYFNRHGNGGIAVDPAELSRLQGMIRLSDDSAADHFYSSNGGNASISRMISTCDLDDSSVYSGWWSKTLISARDLAKLGLCIADGTATNPAATAWILDQMRNVGGDGLFGIKFALPEPDRSELAIKNGWYNHGFDSHWRVLCLGVHPDWVLAIENTYPSSYGRGYGEQNCVTVTKMVLGIP